MSSVYLVPARLRTQLPTLRPPYKNDDVLTPSPPLLFAKVSGLAGARNNSRPGLDFVGAKEMPLELVCGAVFS